MQSIAELKKQNNFFFIGKAVTKKYQANKKILSAIKISLTRKEKIIVIYAELKIRSKIKIMFVKIKPRDLIFIYSRAGKTANIIPGIIMENSIKYLRKISTFICRAP